MYTMWRKIVTAWTGALGMLTAGCMVGPLQDNPVFIRPDPAVTVENPVWVPSLGVGGAYGKVFEIVLDIVDDYFEIAYSRREDGWIVTFPRLSPGLEQFWKPGTPDCYQRLEATLQTIRHRCEVQIQPAEDGGFFVRVTVYKELEDLERPTRATAGAAAFRSDNTVERQFEVIDPTILDTKWVPQGRNKELEQVILQRIKKCM
jgi:hypothetical protein